MLKSVSSDVDLGGKPAVAKVDQYKGTWYLSLRYTWITPTGEVAFSKNGINMPIDVARDAIDALVTVYNEATGSDLKLEG